MLHGGYLGGRLVEVRGKGAVDLEWWLVHGQVCSQRCVGRRHIRKSEFWFLFNPIGFLLWNLHAS